MAINETLNYLLSKRSRLALSFSAAVTTVTADLKGAGGEAGGGFPTPADGWVRRIDCWDGAQIVSASCLTAVQAGDRLALRAVASGGNFNITLLVNGVATTVSADGAAQNTSLFATLSLTLKG